jgi:hypothetical protein
MAQPSLPSATSILIFAERRISRRVTAYNRHPMITSWFFRRVSAGEQAFPFSETKQWNEFAGDAILARALTAFCRQLNLFSSVILCANSKMISVHVAV